VICTDLRLLNPKCSVNHICKGKGFIVKNYVLVEKIDIILKLLNTVQIVKIVTMHGILTFKL
jgi:hypothetical protein